MGDYRYDIRESTTSTGPRGTLQLSDGAGGFFSVNALTFKAGTLFAENIAGDGALLSNLSTIGATGPTGATGPQGPFDERVVVLEQNF